MVIYGYAHDQATLYSNSSGVVDYNRLNTNVLPDLKSQLQELNLFSPRSKHPQIILRGIE
jgi:hypothetical protein